jgi:hypothetical protein
VPTFTSSRYTISAATITADLTLDTLRDAMLQHRPDHAALSGGWASTEDAGSNLRVPNVAPPVSDPELLDDEGDYPQRLLARYYYFRKDPQLVRAYPDAAEQQHHYLDAVDVLISALPDRPMAFQVLFASGNGAMLRGLVRALRAAVLSLDETGSVRHDGASIAFSPDLFLWLFVRARDDRQITSSTQISDVLSATARDSTRRNTLLSDGVDFDRPALLVAVAEIEHLGLARVSLRDDELNATVTADVWASGKFSIIKSETHYPDVVGDAETRLASLQDLAFVLLPRMIQVYSDGADGWGDARRATEIRSAATALIKRYEQKVADHDAALAVASASA